MTSTGFLSWHSKRMTGAVVGSALTVSYLLSGCAVETEKRVDCIVTQASLLEALQITGKQGVIAKVLQEYGVSYEQYAPKTDKFKGAAKTAESIREILYKSRPVQQLYPQDVITFCITFTDKTDFSAGGVIWEYDKPVLGGFETTPVDKIHKVPGYMKDAERQFPEARVFVMNAAQTTLSPLVP